MFFFLSKIIVPILLSSFRSGKIRLAVGRPRELYTEWARWETARIHTSTIRYNVTVWKMIYARLETSYNKRRILPDSLIHSFCETTRPWTVFSSSPGKRTIYNGNNSKWRGHDNIIYVVFGSPDEKNYSLYYEIPSFSFFPFPGSDWTKSRFSILYLLYFFTCSPTFFTREIARIA